MLAHLTASARLTTLAFVVTVLATAITFGASLTLVA